MRTTNFCLKNLGFILILVFPFCYTVFAQSYIGHAFDNYAGVHGIIYNPANVVGSPLRSDINLISVSAFAGSDYFGINLKDIISSDFDFDFDEDALRFPTNNNHFFAIADVLGPSFMFNMGNKHSIAITTRARGFLNLDHISGNLYESISDGFNLNNDFDFDMEDLNGTIHVFGEIGLSYGRVLMEENTNFIKAGISAKYLFGAGGLFANSPRLSGSYTAFTNSLNTSGNLDYGFSQDFDSDDISFDNVENGLGFDLGLVYEFRPRMLSGEVLGRRHQQYKLKVGVALTDIGSIKYTQAENTAYNLNGTVAASEFDSKDLEQVLEDNYTGQTTIGSHKISLPTTLHLSADYHLRSIFYVGIHGALSAVKSNKPSTNHTLNTFTLAPRIETKLFSLYTPLSLRQYGDVAWGFGLRLGPLTIGSGSILTNILSDNSKTSDVYFGLKIPLYKKVDYENRF
ncbi:DUF5723 family protein [uncultured Zobellia sp.]|uniref:DUF5723 family protein n=1 Tax=uncultured Zobellia sp. TaxID=255433 RepID=UPI0025920107|nr:DUF5723 family protein [uncultured Zobellia sp.]